MGFCRQIDLITCDDGANIENALQAIDCAMEFCELGIDAVIGHLGSEASIATSMIYQNHNIVQISPTAIHSALLIKLKMRFIIQKC